MLPYDMSGYDMSRLPKWMQQAAVDPEGEYNDWVAQQERQTAAARKPWEDARDAERRAQIEAEYTAYQQRRAEQGYPARPSAVSATAAVPDWRLINGENVQGTGKPGPDGVPDMGRTRGLAWSGTGGDEYGGYVNQGRQDFRRFAAQDTEIPFDPRVADAEFSGRNRATNTPYAYNRAGRPLPPGVGGPPIAPPQGAPQPPRETPEEIYRSVFPNAAPPRGAAATRSIEARNRQTDPGEMAGWNPPAEPFDPAKYTLDTESILDKVEKLARSQGADVKLPRIPFNVAAAAGPTGMAAYEALSQPLDPRLIALQVLGLKGAGKSVPSSANFIPNFRMRGGAPPISPQRPVHPPWLSLPPGQPGENFVMQPGFRPSSVPLPSGGPAPLQLGESSGTLNARRPNPQTPVYDTVQGPINYYQRPEPNFIIPNWQPTTGNLPSLEVFPERLRRLLMNQRLGYETNPWGMP